jgi:hypothetical protein
MLKNKISINLYTMSSKYTKRGGRYTRRKKKHTRKKRKYKKKTKHNAHSSKQKKFKKMKCSPKGNKKLDFETCYTIESLHKLKQIWNARHPDVKIVENDPRNIWEQLRSHMATSCNTEACWLKHQCIKNDIEPSLWENTFAPKSPIEWKKKPNEWLTSVDIEKVMKQYEKSNKCFDFIGPSPIDFDKHLLWDECVWEELCKFQLKTQMKKGKTKIGIIFNLDPHTEDGSHWVSMFINIKKHEIYYFDSYGDKIPKLIMEFVKRVQKQGRELGIDMKDKWVSNRHQYSSSECGMYSLFFIIQLLKDTKNFDDFENHKFKDKYMKKLRKIYFNPR